MTSEKASVLVVSDNADLVHYLQNEIEHKKYHELAKFEYAFSIINKNPDALKSLGALGVNVKDARFVSEAKNKYSLIISLHCKQIFPKNLVSSVLCVNFHPGLNPFNRGWYPQVFSIINKMPVGATLHVMDEDVDHGEIIDQKEVSVEEYDTSLELYNRVMEAEKRLISANLLSLINKSYSTELPSGEGNYNSISSFNQLCDLDLKSNGSLKEHIDLLRALSHGDFNNAFFRDEKGKKIYVKISLSAES